MPKGKSTSNSVIPKLALLGLTLTSKHIQDEEVWTFPEDQIHIVHKVLKFGITGKNNQAIHPVNGLVITKEKLKKILDKISEKENKQDSK